MNACASPEFIFRSSARIPTLSPEQGIAYAVAAVACFAALDTVAKLVSMAVPLFVLVWFRFAFQTVVSAAVLLPRRGAGVLRTREPLLQLTRGVLQVVSSAIGFLSLRFMPVGEYTAIVLLTPLLVTLLAAMALSEKVSPTRWLLLAGGLAGALLVIRPGTQMFHWAMLLPLALVVTNAIFHILTSRLAHLEDGHTTQFYGGWVGFCITTLVLPFVWEPIGQWQVWAGLLLLGTFSTSGHFLLIQAYVRAAVATLTPFLYLQIGFAALAGWLVFAHVPDGWAMAGIALIALCGAAGTGRFAITGKLAFGIARKLHVTRGGG